MRLLTRATTVVLLVLAIVFLAGAVWITYRVLMEGLDNPPIAAAALLATVAGLFLTARLQVADHEEKTSRFYLERYEAGFDTAYEILASAEPGDPLLRMKWIAAARVLATAQQLHRRISVKAHRQVAEMDIPHQSQRFQQFLNQPAWYYYGVVMLPTLQEPSLDEAAKLSTKDQGTIGSTLRAVPEKVIRTVWQAIAYPGHYKDVLGERFTEGERLLLAHRGVQAYLDHLDRWHSAVGVLHERAAREPRE